MANLRKKKKADIEGNSLYITIDLRKLVAVTHDELDKGSVDMHSEEWIRTAFQVLRDMIYDDGNSFLEGVYEDRDTGKRYEVSIATPMSMTNTAMSDLYAFLDALPNIDMEQINLRCHWKLETSTFPAMVVFQDFSSDDIPRFASHMAKRKKADEEAGGVTDFNILWSDPDFAVYVDDEFESDDRDLLFTSLLDYMYTHLEGEVPAGSSIGCSSQADRDLSDIVNKILPDEGKDFPYFKFITIEAIWERVDWGLCFTSFALKEYME